MFRLVWLKNLIIKYLLHVRKVLNIYLQIKANITFFIYLYYLILLVQNKDIFNPLIKIIYTMKIIEMPYIASNLCLYIILRVNRKQLKK